MKKQQILSTKSYRSNLNFFVSDNREGHQETILSGSIDIDQMSYRQLPNVKELRVRFPELTTANAKSLRSSVVNAWRSVRN